MTRTRKPAMAAAAVGAVFAPVVGASTAHAAGVPDPASGAVTAFGPWTKYATYSTEGECGRVGHHLVNSDRYADYTCSRSLAGWDLWVRR